MDDREVQYTVQGANGVRNGPMPRYRVVELIERGFLVAEDRVEKEGEKACPLATHPDFAGFFIEGDSRFEQLTDARRQRRIRNNRYRRQRWRRSLTRLAAGFAGIAGIGWAVVHYERWLPPSAEDWVSETFLGGQESPVEAISQEEVPQILTALLADLSGRYEGQTGKPASVYAAGIESLVSGESVRRREALEYMEKAVLFSAGESWTIGGLIAAMSHSEEAMTSGRMDSYVAHLKNALDGRASLSLGLGYRALVRGDLGEAAAHASSCMEGEDYRPLCHWVTASAMGRAGQMEGLGEVLADALELFPRSPEMLLWDAEHKRAAGDFDAAEARLRTIATTLGTDENYLRVRAGLYMEVGEFEKAIETFESLVKKNSSDRRSALTLGTVLNQHRRNPQEALLVLESAIESGLEDFADDDKIFLQASHAHRTLGNLDEALSHSEQAIRRGPADAPVQLSLALALEAKGDLVGAEAVFDAMEFEGVEGRELARIHAWAAGLYLQTGRLRLARDQIRAGQLAEPNWPVLGLLGAVVDLRLGDFDGLESRLEESLLRDLREDSSRLPTLATWGVGVDVDPLVDLLESRLEKEPRWALEVSAFVSAVRLLECQQDGDCRRVHSALRVAQEQGLVSPLTLLARAQLAVQEERWEEALRVVRRVKTQRGEHPVLLGLEGAALTGLQRYEEATRVLEEGFRGQEEDGSLAGRWLVRAYAESGNWEAAKRLEREIRRRDPHVFVTGAFLRARALDSSK